MLPDLSANLTADSRVTIKKIDLYDAFTSSWFKSQFERMTQHASDLSGYTRDGILRIFNEYAKDLAFEMFLNDTQVIRRVKDSSSVDEAFKKFFIGTAGDEASKRAAELGFQGSPLKIKQKC